MTDERDEATGRAAPMAVLRAPSAALAFAVPAFAALAAAAPAWGQVPDRVQDYRLPPASPAPGPQAAGPVDSEHPVATPTRPAPLPPSPITLPPPAPTATATPAPQPSPARLPQAERPRPRPTAAPPTTGPAPPGATPGPAPGPAPGPTPATPPPESPSAIPPPPVAATAPAPAAPLAEPSRPDWPWIVGAALMLTLLAAGALRRGFGRSAAPAPPEPAPPTEPPLPTEPAPPAPVAPTPPPPLDVQLEVRHLSRAMVYATLAYRLTLTNRTQAPLGPLRIAGDIVSAHASLPAGDLLAPGDAALAAIHEVPSLPPGEALTLGGELRLPIADILPIRSGGGRVFVPLARFRIEAAGAVTTRVFVVGREGTEPGGALRPFPLDHGPGVDRAIGQRELGVSA